MKVIDLLNKIAKGEATNETDFALKEDLKITNMNILKKVLSMQQKK